MYYHFHQDLPSPGGVTDISAGPESKKLKLDENTGDKSEDKKADGDAKSHDKDRDKDTKPGTSGVPEAGQVGCDEPDAMEENLICIICQEILHDCIR